MKGIIISFLSVLSLCSFAQLTYVPDDNFEQALIDFGYDKGDLDDFVATENIIDVTYLNVEGIKIYDLTGIEDFVSLTDLNCAYNDISSLELSTNTALTTLNCSVNLISSLDLSTNIALAIIDCNCNLLSSLDLSENTALTKLNCS